MFALSAEGDFGKQTIATLLAGVTAAANFEAAGAANKLQISSTASVRELAGKLSVQRGLWRKIHMA